MGRIGVIMIHGIGSLSDGGIWYPEAPKHILDFQQENYSTKVSFYYDLDDGIMAPVSSPRAVPLCSA
eukprot:6199564-Pleurochrysis_carterae.AAC.3